MKKQIQLIKDLFNKHKKEEYKSYNKQYAILNNGHLKKDPSSAFLKPYLLMAVIAVCSTLLAPKAIAQVSFESFVLNPFSLEDIGLTSASALVDLDNDGDLDILTGTGSVGFYYYENIGTKTAPAYDTRVLNPFSLTDITNRLTASLADLDNDGDLDLISGDQNGKIHYMENTGSKSAPSFAAPIENPFSIVNVGSDTTPVFVDMDDDGDYDIMSGEANGSFFYFQNTGTITDPVYAAPITNPFSLIDIGFSSYVGMVDLDNDGDMDLMAGDDDGDLEYFENIGTAAAANFATVQTNPFMLTNLFREAKPTFGDLDFDGDLDMMAGVYSGTYRYFENITPTPQLASFGVGVLDPFSLSGIGIEITVTLVDLDNDGDLDLMQGGRGGGIFYYQNTGTSSVPTFAARVNDPFSIVPSPARRNTTGSFADLDNDGDLDYMTGASDGNFHYYPNNGTAAVANFGAVQTDPFSLVNIGSYSDPQLVDLDNDGDYDLMSGEDGGGFFYFQNTGTIMLPAFAPPVSNPFSLTDIGNSSNLTFADLDKDGDIDLISGETGGNFNYFENIGTPEAPVFATVSVDPFSLSDIGTFSSPAFGDLDNDGDFDLMVGYDDNDFYYFENSPTLASNTWIGATSSLWTDATNWSNAQMPTSNEAVVISTAANNPIITTPVEINNLTIEVGGNLSVDDASLIVSSGLIIDGTLSIASGASLVPMGFVAGIGDATIHRSTTFGILEGKYSVIGSPIMTGNTDDLGGIVYSYDETIPYEPGIGNSNGGNRFVIATSEAMSIGDAYFSANTGDISFTGLPNSGDIDIPLVYNLGQDGAGAGFNLVSNPYPAAINYNDFVANNADIDGTIYLWDDGGSDIGTRDNSDYITANSMGVASGGSGRAASWDGYIRSVQGFFVKATTAGTLSFTPSMMDDGNNSKAGFFRTEKPRVLKFSLASDIHFNEILIGFTDKATLGFDRTLDAHKAKGNNDLQFYSRMNEDVLAIQALPNLVEETKVDLGFDIAEAGIYTFELQDAAQYGFGIYLKDHKLGKLIDFSEQNAYTFQSSAVQNSNRFSLIFSPNTVLAIDNKAIKNNDMIVFSNTAGLNVRMSQKLKNAKVSIYNLSGTLVKEVSQVDFAGADWTTRFNQQGLFIMTVQTEGQLYVKKFFKD